MIKNNLFVQAISKFLMGVIIIGLLLFLPAGSLQYWQGWLLFIAAFVVAGLNWRFNWYVLPNWAVWVSAGLFK